MYPPKLGIRFVSKISRSVIFTNWSFNFSLENQPPTLVRHRDDTPDSALAGMSVGSVSMLVSGAGAFMMVFSNSSLFLYFFPPPSFYFSVAV
jgi:hypothetical protein